MTVPQLTKSALILPAAILLLGATDAPEELALDCAFFSGEEQPAALPPPDGWDARLTFVRRGGKFRTVEVDGPPLFSTTQGLVSYTVSGNGQMRSESPKPKKWDVVTAGPEIELTRGKSEIKLQGADGAMDRFAGTWVISDTLGGHPLLADGEMACFNAALAGAGEGQ